MNIETIVKEKQCTIIDVRTPSEFSGGHVVGSINIPLQDLTDRLEEMKSMKQPLVFCCASGGRSGQASDYLSLKGLECYNGGSWLTVNAY